jgi:hypothetical protein
VGSQNLSQDRTPKARGSRALGAGGLVSLGGENVQDALFQDPVHFLADLFHRLLNLGQRTGVFRQPSLQQGSVVGEGLFDQLFPFRRGHGVLQAA